MLHKQTVTVPGHRGEFVPRSDVQEGTKWTNFDHADRGGGGSRSARSACRRMLFDIRTRDRTILIIIIAVVVAHDGSRSAVHTPAVMQVMSTPRWFTGTDGRVHLVCELQLTNGFPVPVTVTDVTVRDADSGTTVETLSGDGLPASMSLLSTGTTPTVEIPPSSVAVAWIDAGFDNPGQLPKRVDHSLTVTVPPGLPVPETIT